MTQWIEITRVRQNGEPITRSIKITGMDEEIWFTTNAVAEVSDAAADLLASNNDFINKISEPADPGTYYEGASANQSIVLNLPDGAFDEMSVQNIDINGGLDIASMEASDPFEPASLKTTSVDTERVFNPRSVAVRYFDLKGDHNLKEEFFSDIQSAVDAIPKVDTADSGTGIVTIYSRGARDSDGAEPYTNPVLIDTRGITVHGTGIHCHLEADNNSEAVKIANNDIWFHSIWVNNNGSGDGIRVSGRESKISNINIDGAGNCAIKYTNTDPGPHQLGPCVELKDGPTAAVETQGRVEGRGLIIEEYFENMTVGDGIISRQDDKWSDSQILITNDVSGAGLSVQGPRVGASNMLIRNAVRKLDSDGPTRGIDIQGEGFNGSNIDIVGVNAVGVDIRSKRCHLSNVSVSDSPESGSGDHIPDAAFRVRSNDNQLLNVSEFNCGTGVEFYGGIRNRITGEFPDGFTENSAGDADKNIINGLGWDSAGSGSTPATSDWDWCPGVTVWNRDDDTYWKLNGDGSAFTQLA